MQVRDIYVACLVVLVMTGVIRVVHADGDISPLSVSVKPFLWTDSMKKVKITSIDQTLTFEVTIKNSDLEKWASIDSFQVSIKGTINTDGGTKVIQRVFTEDSLYLPPGQSLVRFVMISMQQEDPYGYKQWAVGKWTFEMTYEIWGLLWVNATGQVPAGGSTQKQFSYQPYPGKIEPYPFEFRMASSIERMNEIIKEEEPALINIGDITIVIPVAVIGLGGLVLWAFKKRK